LIPRGSSRSVYQIALHRQLHLIPGLPPSAINFLSFISLLAFEKLEIVLDY
jgi:hypothetical protein